MDQPPLIISPPYIRKPTALIHFERELSVVAQKVMTLIVSHCQKETKNARGFYLIEKRRVCELLGWEASCNHLRVVEAFREIFNNTVAWNLFEQDRTFKRLECKLIISLLVPTEVGPSVGFQLHPELEPVIQSPKVFGQILLEVPALLARSEYAFPLYELLADHVSRDDGSLRIALADLKRYLGLKGRYPVFQKFKERVLAPSLDSININTDLQVNYEIWQTGRAVSGLIFHVQRQSQLVKLVEITEKTLAAPSTLIHSSWSPEEQQFLKRLIQHQISEEDAIQALQTHGLDGAREIYGYVRQEVIRRKNTPEEIRNVPAYLARCFHKGFGRKGEADHAIESAQAARTEQAATQNTALATRAAQTESVAKARIAEIQTRWAALSAAEQGVLEQAFLHAEPIWAGRPANSISRIKAFQRWLAGPGGLPLAMPITAD